MGRGYRLMAIKPTDNSADQEQKRNKKENQDRQNNNLAITNCKKLHTTKVLVTHAKIRNYVIRPKIADEYFPSLHVHELPKIR